MISETSELSSARYRDSVPVTIETALCQLFQIILCGRRMCIAGIVGSCNLVVLVAQIAVEGIHKLRISRLFYCKPSVAFRWGWIQGHLPSVHLVKCLDRRNVAQPIRGFVPLLSVIHPEERRHYCSKMTLLSSTRLFHENIMIA